MMTRNELILQFMLAMADSDRSPAYIYDAACAYADMYLNTQA
jgi:hypothetical protein